MDEITTGYIEEFIDVLRHVVWSLRLIFFAICVMAGVKITDVLTK